MPSVAVLLMTRAREGMSRPRADLSAVGFGQVEGAEDVDDMLIRAASLARSVCFSNRHNSIEDNICRRRRFLVLEESYDRPPIQAKRTVGVSVARLIRFELGDPPLTVSSRGRAVFWTRMPKATIDEDGNPLGGEHNIDATTIPYDGPINKKTEAEPMQRRPQRKLWTRVASLRASHALTDNFA